MDDHPSILALFENVFIFSLRSVYGILRPVSSFISKADSSALQFPFISVWPGIQYNIIFLVLFTMSIFCNNFMIIGSLD